MTFPLLPMAEIKVWMRRFKNDSGRGISILAMLNFIRMSEQTFIISVLTDEQRMSEETQRKLSKFIYEWENGIIDYVKRFGPGKTVQYTQAPKPRVEPHWGLTLDNGRFRIDLGSRKKGVYNAPSLKERIDGRKA